MIRGTSLQQIANWLKTVPVGLGDRSTLIQDFSTDTRTLKAGCLFIALRGEHFDGHDYIVEALQRGASAILCERLPDQASQTKSIFFKVSSSPLAFAEIAKQLRNQFLGKVIAITGSAGKSSTKDMAGVLLGPHTLVSPKSFNNLLGVSKTICLVSEDTQNLVLEMGMNARGEISQMCDFFNPQGGAITNIGDAHIGKLGGREGIFQAKKELFDHLGKIGGPLGVALNLDDPWVMRAAAEALGSQIRRITYSSLDPNADIFLTNRRVCAQTGKLSFDLDLSGKKLKVSLPHFGVHQALNTAAAVAIAKLMGIPDSQIEERLPLLVPSESRGVMKELSQGVTVIDESYNSNPTALLSTLESVFLMAPHRRKLFVIGEMRELEDFSDSLHHEVGEKLSKQLEDSASKSVILGVGALTQPLLDAIQENSKVEKAHFESVEDLNRAWDQFLQPQDLILLKGSRGVGLEKTLPVLEDFTSKGVKK